MCSVIWHGMQVFVYEYVSGGGMWEASAVHDDASLLRQGQAMARAITEDLAASPNMEVWTTRDARLPDFHSAGCRVTAVRSADEDRETIERLAHQADRTLLIAPETDGAQLRRCQWAQAA